MNYVVITSIGAICMAIFAMFIRMKAAKKPATAKKIILPPIFMSTGALMFIFPYFRVTPLELAEAVIVGLLFSILLIKTSKFEIRDKDIYLKRSKAFLYILIGLLVIRMAGKLILSSTIDYGQLSGMFWILAFGMIVPWRIAMYINFKKLQQELYGSVK
ncbi:CcdC family protein [Cytobacillus praedii]|uniref:Cytochrome c biogenesis protein CcdC n=1 Tax=Cytobacillus praedii TaxID=1742358 RepID=A0A4R1APF1_9BACI|nr:cytochrome c biogenesis protein CcdC [Cytobacillus praedii]MED3552064.1 cytochrome c biogenesis protein CcdC [Cytobacillus praedii]MED3573288.1 cytochrome c biogenesis protein CcdC [Cytobacillus praedii]TCJ01773.1 cytochrome c biogenesis protein CcdC [Cytobacillus praedii]